MASMTVIQVRFHQQRYLADGPWPPSPGRLFQALVAGCAPRAELPEVPASALRWLEEQPAPVVHAPKVVWGSPLVQYVPHNHLDAKGGDPGRVASVRAPKHTRARLLPVDASVVYVWPAPPAQLVCALEELAQGLYSLGRGQDQAWARLRVVDAAELEEMVDGLVRHGPTPGTADGAILTCPCPGSLDSLVRRHAAQLGRLSWSGRTQVLSRAPQALLREIRYGGNPVARLYELQDDHGRFSSAPAVRCVSVVEEIRDQAEGRLVGTGVERLANQARRYLSGRLRGASPLERVQLLPLPSIGHEHVDGAIRRVLVRVPPTCPVDGGDLHWAIQQCSLDGAAVVAAADTSMLRHYGLERGQRRWTSVTPVVLPDVAARRRLEPGVDRKSADERLVDHGLAEAAVADALRHAGVRARMRSVEVRREPFTRKGDRAELYARGTRFAKERLWHLRLALDRPVRGPLVLGDGRFLGLGLMAPEREPARAARVWGLPVLAGLVDGADPIGLARAFRRAVLSRLGGGHRRLSAYLSGHELDGGPTRNRDHLAFAFATWGPPELLVVAPASDRHRRDVQRLVVALDDLAEVRAGAAGLLRLGRSRPVEDGPMVDRSRVWVSHTPYTLTRHVDAGSAQAAVETDVRLECDRSGLPQPRVQVGRIRSVSRAVEARVTLRFAAPVCGPLLLGRTRYQGGGLFLAERSR